jgi:hypothetical protein
MNARPQIISSGEMIVSGAVLHVKAARNHLLVARCNIDDAGYFCPALDDLHSDATVLVADWHGRPVPVLDNAPAWVAMSAAEWRRQNRRSY